MLTNKDYCDYDTSIALSELGFPLKRMKVKNFIDGQFSDSIVTVLLYEAQKWLREEKGIIVEPTFAYMDEKWDKYYSVQIVTDIRFDDENYTYECATIKFEESKGYEEALSEGIKEAVKLLKDGIGE